MSAALREVLTAELIERLRGAGLDPQEVTRIVSAALDEDLAGRGRRHHRGDHCRRRARPPPT